MGRKPTITRNLLLDIAEDIVRSDGAKGLTIEALARSAGVSKGGVQYSFASKDDLVRALIERWINQFDEMLKEDEPTTAVTFVHRYIQAMRASPEAMDAKMAGLMIANMGSSGNLREVREWYHAMFERLGAGTPDERAARVAFLAVEGLFLLRIVGVDDDDTLMTLLDDVESTLTRLTGRSPPQSPTSLADDRVELI